MKRILLLLATLSLAPGLIRAQGYTGSVKGAGASLSGISITASSATTGGNIASITFVSISTITANLRGSLKVVGHAGFVLQNAAASLRSYTFQIDRGTATVFGPTGTDVEAGKTQFVGLDWLDLTAPGAINFYSLKIKSSSASGTQTAATAAFFVLETP